MSRTYNHDIERKNREFDNKFNNIIGSFSYQFYTQWNKHYNWPKNEPKWWRKLYKHKKRRIKTKQLLNKQLKDVKEELVYPLDKKPWIYYW